DTVFICNPNNPTGTLISAQKIKMICLSFPNSNFIIDESYLSFVEAGDKGSMKGSDLSNLIVLNSMSKIFRIPGLRVGFLIASKGIINKFNRFMLPWNVNSLAQAAVSYLMTQKIEIDSFLEQTREFVKNQSEKLTKTLESTGQIKVIPSTTVFLLAKLPDNLNSDKVCEHLLQNRILVRNCSNFKDLSEQFIRISLKTRDINRIVADKLAVLISDLSN
ncbi:MAG: histidinol-phosphate aminotransferase family protein, partial [Deltaproteobacteria bacterium]|nr:histidinol-phosphate aminotransferase family protein [Deltaproteobacteria bacterium]